MTPKFKNDLNFYTLEFAETPEMAQAMADRFIEKFNSLDKYDQLAVSPYLNCENFSKAFEILNIF